MLLPPTPSTAPDSVSLAVHIPAECWDKTEVLLNLLQLAMASNIGSLCCSSTMVSTALPVSRRLPCHYLQHPLQTKNKSAWRYTFQPYVGIRWRSRLSSLDLAVCPGMSTSLASMMQPSIEVAGRGGPDCCRLLLLQQAQLDVLSIALTCLLKLAA